MAATKKAGGTAKMAIAYLRTLPPGEEVTTADLAAAVGRAAAGFGQYMVAAVQQGAVTRRAHFSTTLWGLGPNCDGPVRPPGDDERRVLRASASAVPSIFAYADAQVAAPFSASLSTDGRMRIERHGRLVLELSDAERAILLRAAVVVQAPGVAT